MTPCGPETATDCDLLLRRFANGETAALDLLYRACADRAWNQARRLLGDGTDAEDAVQEAFVQLARSAADFDGRVPFGAWLGRLVHDAALQIRRARQRRQAREDAVRSQNPSATPAAESAVDEELIRTAVAELGESDQRTIALHYFAGLDQAETAAALGISCNALGVRLHRARERLRGILGRRGIAAAQVALLLAALDNLPAASAPPAVLTQAGRLADQAAHGALPVSTLPTGTTASLPTALMVGAGLALAIGIAWLAWPVPAPPPAAVAEIAPPAPLPPPQPQPQPRLEPGWRDLAARRLLHVVAPGDLFSAGVDWQEILRSGVGAKPGTLFRDPRAKAWLDHIRSQCAGQPALRWDGLLTSTAGMVCTGWPVTERRRDTVALLFSTDLGDQAADLSAYAHHNPELHLLPNIMDAVGDASAAWTAHAEDAHTLIALSVPHHRLIGADGLAARDELVRREKAGNELPPLPAPLWATLDLACLLQYQHYPIGDPLRLARWLGPDWQHGRLESQAWITADGPLTRSRLQRIRLPLRLPEADLWSHWRSPALASLALGSDALPALARLPGLPPQVTAALATLRGDVLIQVHQATPFPSVVAILLRNGNDKPWRDLAGMLGLPPDPSRPGVFSGFTGMQQARLELAPGMAVVTLGDPGSLPAAGAQPPAPAPLLASLDLPVLARTWLPLATAAMSTMSMPLPGPLAGSIRVVGRDHPWTAPELRRTFGELAALLPPDGLDRLVSFRSWNRDRFHTSVLVLRFSDGWRVIRNNQAELLHPLDLEGMRAAIAGTTPVSNGDPAALEVMPFAPPGRIDQGWLPPVAVLADHLPAWSLRVDIDAEGTSLEEHGLPLAAAMLHAGALGLAGQPGLLERLPAADREARF